MKRYERGHELDKVFIRVRERHYKEFENEFTCGAYIGI